MCNVRTGVQTICQVLFLGFICSFFIFAEVDLAHARQRQELISLCYHHVVLTEGDMIVPDTMPITVDSLVEHFEWLKVNGYTVVSLDDIIAADKGEKPLPAKAVLLSFDDGYDSLYTTIYPLLQAYNYPAVFALETSWLETPAHEAVEYTEIQLPRSNFITWEQAREMVQSGLVEIGTHTHDLHKSIAINPQLSGLPAACHLEYFPDTMRYETENEYRARLRNDLKRSADIISRKTGKRPRMIVWPYGHYTMIGAQIGAELGMPYSASLEVDTTVFTGQKRPFTVIKRALITGGNADGFSELVLDMTDKRALQTQRIVHVDLDYIYDPDAAATQRNMDALIQRLSTVAISAVYLQAYADPDGNGTADALYFPNRHLPVRADLFSWASSQLRDRLGVEIYAWMPVLGFDLGDDSMVIQSTSADKKGSTYRRLSPFNARARHIIREIYRDLSSHAYFDGLVFHDDAIMGDYEDVSPSGRQWMADQGLPQHIEKIHENPESMDQFTRGKSRALIDFTQELTEEVRYWKPDVKTVRNMYALPVLDPATETWFAQNLDDFLRAYNYTGIMAMPYMEKASDPDEWLGKLADAVLAHPLGATRAVFELQSVDWSKGNSPISSKTLAAQMRLLIRKGIRNVGYYPDDFVKNHPDLQVLSPIFSLRDNLFIENRQ